MRSPRTGWHTNAASEICEKIQDGTHFSPKVQHGTGPYPYVTAKNVRPTGLDLHDVTYLDEGTHRPIFRRCDVAPGDVLLVKDGVNAGDAAINTIRGEISLLSSVCFLRPKETVLATYIRYYLLSPQGRRHLLGSLTGTAIRRIILARVRELPVVVAPLPEQRRIVATIETYFSRLDAAVASLTHAKASVKRARASVLKAAVEGQLVPTEAALARAEGRSYEPASVLLARIFVEFKAKRLPSRRKGKHTEASEPGTEQSPDVPEGWAWARVDQLSSEQLCNGRSVPTREGGFPVLRLTAMENGRLVFSESKGGAWSKEAAMPWLVETGDFFIMRGNGSLNRVGSAAIAGQVHLSVAFPDTMIRLRPVKRLVEPDYLLVAWRSPAVRAQIEASARTTAGIHKVNQGAIADYAIPLPPLVEQRRIAAEVDRHFSVLDALDTSLDASLARCARLRQSILKRAFEGRLSSIPVTEGAGRRLVSPASTPV